MPNIQVKLRRGTTAQHAGFTGAEGEVTVDTDKETLVVHDNATAGGHELAKASDAYVHPNHTGDVTSTGDGATVIADNAVTSGKISDTDTNFNVTAAGKVGIGKVNGGGYQLEIDGDLLVQDTGDNFPAAVFAGSGGAAIQLNDQSSNGQVYNVSSNPDSSGRGGFSIGHIGQAGAALVITHVSSTASLSTFSTSSAHGLTEGQYGQLAGGDAEWAVATEIVDVPSATTFVVPKFSASTNYPTSLTPNDSFTAFLVRRHTEANVLYNMVKFLGLPKDTDNGGSAGTQPNWLEAGQLWIDTTDNSIKIQPEVTT
jgi:hypothetical protein